MSSDRSFLHYKRKRHKASCLFPNSGLDVLPQYVSHCVHDESLQLTHVVGGSLVMHAPTSTNELQLTIPHQVLHCIAHTFCLVIVPPASHKRMASRCVRRIHACAKQRLWPTTPHYSNMQTNGKTALPSEERHLHVDESTVWILKE